MDENEERALAGEIRQLRQAVEKLTAIVARLLPENAPGADVLDFPPPRAGDAKDDDE